MKFIINKNQIDSSPEQFLRKAGYGYHRDRRTGKDSFSRRLGSGIFPKLHMYVKEQGEKVVFDLHLDQKQASYSGSRMHNAEHDGEVVSREIERLKQLTSPQPSPSKGERASLNDSLKGIGHGELPKNEGVQGNPSSVKASEGKESWWKKLFS